MQIKYVGASLRGPRNAKLGKPRQDHLHFSNPGTAEDSEDYLVAYGTTTTLLAVAVADGASTAPKSHIGARAATEAAASSVKDLSRESLEEALRQALNAITGLEGGAEDYATTLAIGVIGPGRCAGASIGDSTVVAISNGEPILLTEPDKGEDPSETVFLTSEEALERARFGYAENCSGIVVMTDGVEGAIQITPTDSGYVYKPLDKFFKPLIGRLANSDPGEYAAWLLNYLRKLEATYPFMDDDKTIAVAVTV